MSLRGNTIKVIVIGSEIDCCTSSVISSPQRRIETKCRTKCVHQVGHPNQASKSRVTMQEAAKQAKEQVVGSKQEGKRHKYRQLKPKTGGLGGRESEGEESEENFFNLVET